MKIKVASVHAVKACGGSRGIAVLISNLYARWGWVVIITPRERTPGTH
jgi:hypothetical protein